MLTVSAADALLSLYLTQNFYANVLYSVFTEQHALMSLYLNKTFYANDFYSVFSEQHAYKG
jgi:hypothetical protein